MHVMVAPIPPQMKQRWKEHSSPHQQHSQGLRDQPQCLQAIIGCGHCWLTACRSLWCTRLLPVPEPLWSCWQQALVPNLVEELAFLSWGPGRTPANPSWCKPPCACKILTLRAATWIARLVSSMRNPCLLSCRESLLARSCRAEAARSSLDRQGRDHPCHKATSPGRTQQAIGVGTEPFLHCFAPTDIWVSLCPATQHACWKGESKCRWE